MFYLKVALRNIFKNTRRSLFTIIPIVIGMTSCILTLGFFHWYIDYQREAMIRQGIGHYQLYVKGFSQYGPDDPYSYLINDAAPIVKELQRIPGIKLVTTRMAFNGILSSSEKSTVIMGEAGIPADEVNLNTITTLISGHRLSLEKPYGIVVGDGVAKKLSAKIGDTLTLMGYMSDGGINAIDLELTGITHSGYSELDNVTSTAALRVIQDLLDIDDSVQKIIILLNRTEETDKIRPKIDSICKKYGLEYKDWQVLAEFYQSLKLMFNAVFLIIISIILTIVMFTISNTVNMNLNDRIREIGTMRALGTRRIQVAEVFIAESFLIGIIGGFIGLFISYLFIGVTDLLGGLPIAIKTMEQPTIIRIHFHPLLRQIVECIFAFTFIAIVSSILPSRKASKISITEALRWI